MIRQLFLLVFAWSLSISGHPEFDKVVIWGHKLYSHSHSFIHYGFFKAFNHLGYKTYWFDHKDDISNFDFSNSLILASGQDDRSIPIRQDCFYILHNCDLNKYKQIVDQKNYIILQVYTNDILNRNLQKIEDCVYIDSQDRCIYLPWATDLLPDEIELQKKDVSLNYSNKSACFIGTIEHGGRFSNKQEVENFFQECKKNQFKIISHGMYGNNKSVTLEENLSLVKNSLLAPAIQGKWQAEVGYIPCRIFKNISYGKLGITNSKTVYDLFQKKIVYNPNTRQLFYDAMSVLKKISTKDIFEMMDLVKERHTYINRIETILKFLNQLELQNN